MTLATDYQTSYRTPGYDPRYRRIVSVDGEGNDIDGRHSYTLLAAADDRGFSTYVQHDGSKRPEEAYRGANHGLRTRQCLDFLLDLKQDDSDLFTAFAFVYDVTKILADVPVMLLTRLAETERCEWADYVIEFRPRKWFSVTDLRSYYCKPDGKPGYRRKIKIWDTFAYFQKSFVSALLSASSDLFDRDELKFIEDMKARRDDFENEDPDTILKYCLSECRCLSVLIRDILTQFDRLGYSLNDYSGPGPIAAAYYRKVNLKDYMPEDHPHYICNMPKGIAELAYFGGRFETSITGPVGDCWAYDIRSAYPAVAATLPCLRHAKFEEVSEFVPGEWGFYKVGSHTSGPWAPFPFRTKKDTVEFMGEGSIVYAHGGIRWVGQDEVAVARKHFGDDAIPVYKGFVLRRMCDHRPLADVEDLFNYRAELKVKGDGAEKAIKLIINAIYGKLAQSIGWKLNPRIGAESMSASVTKPPPFQCFPWAAWITSGTRAKVLDAALIAGDQLVSIATDGILTKVKIPELGEDHKKLGDWEKDLAPNVWLGMPGIYTYDKYDKDGNLKPPEFKTRGFSQKWFPPDYLREQWAAGEWSVDPVPELNGKPFKPRAFIPIKQGVRRKDPRKSVGEWAPATKELDFRPKRRIPVLRDGVDYMLGHDGGAIDTVPYELPHDAESASYQPRQTWEDVVTRRTIDNEIVYLDEEADIHFVGKDEES